MRVLAQAFILMIMIVPIQAWSQPAQSVYVLAIGNNFTPIESSNEQLENLRYADDDAASFCDLVSYFTDKITLLSVPDDETQQRFPHWSKQARPPTVAELRISVSELTSQVQQDRKAGIEPVVMIFYSGHGWISPHKGPSLALLDGSLTQHMLYREILGRLPARYIHLFIDACHAEAVVRPRGNKKREVSSRTIALADINKRHWMLNRTLERFPTVGVIMASETDQEAHEWDEYHHGVFTHELLSGLRGAADVNNDKMIEYSELHAFFAAANRDVKESQARLKVLVVPPLVNRRVSLIDWTGQTNSSRLEGELAALGHFYIEDDLGNRILDGNSEEEYTSSLVLPSNQRLFIRSRTKGEVSFKLHKGEIMKLSALNLQKPTVAIRGAVENALWEGLFHTPFGPAYYRGFADRTEAIAVPSAESLQEEPQYEEVPKIEREKPTDSSMVWPAVSWISGGTFLALAAISGGMALDARNDWEQTDIRREAVEAEDRYNQWRTVFFVSSGFAVAATIVGFLLYPFGDDPRTTAQDSSLVISPTGVSYQIRW